MAQNNYTAQVDRDVAATKALMLAVHRESVERQIELMQTPRNAGGHIRIDTGFLRASLRGALGQANFTVTYKPDTEGAAYSWDPGDITMIIASAELDDAIEVVYTANYALPREFGARGQEGDRWVALSAQRWPQTVDGVVRDLKTRSRR